MVQDQQFSSDTATLDPTHLAQAQRLQEEVRAAQERIPAVLMPNPSGIQNINPSFGNAVEGNPADMDDVKLDDDLALGTADLHLSDEGGHALGTSPLPTDGNKHQATDTPEAAALKDKIFQLAVDGKLDDVGMIATSVNPTGNANSQHDQDGKKKKKDGMDTAQMLLLLQEQAAYWGEQADMYEAQSNAVNMAMENVENGKDPTDGMSDIEKENFEDAVQEYKDKYGLTDVDLTDPDVLRQIKALADENQTQARTNEAEADKHLANIETASTKEELDIAIQDAAEAELFVAIKVFTGTDEHAQEILEERGESSTVIKKSVQAMDLSNDIFSTDADMFDTELGLNTSDFTTSHSSAMDDALPFGKEPISSEFQTAALGQPEAQPVNLELDNTLAQRDNSATPSEPGQSFS